MSSAPPDDGIPWYKKSHLRRLNFSIATLVLFSASSGYDGSLMNGLQALPQWQEFMGNPSGAWLGFINASASLGTFTAYPCVAWVCNKYGRKRSIAIGYIFVILGTVLQTTAKSSGQFVVARYCIGQASAWWGGSAPLLITEIAYPSHRGILTAMYNTGWYVGSLLAAWITFGTRNYANSWAWRIPSVAQIFIPAIQILGFLMAPESPRFHTAKGEMEAARQILTKYHAGGEDTELVRYEMAEIEHSIVTEQESNRSSSYMDMFKTPGNRRRLYISVTLGIAAQWNGVGVVSYYLSLVLETAGIKDLTQQTTINGCLQIWNLIFAVGAAFSVDRIGRRSLWLTSCMGMLASYILITALSGSFATTGSAPTGIAVIPCLFVYYAFYDIAFTPILVSYIAEIWTYQLRAKGMAVMQCVTYIAIFFNTFVNPIGLGSIGWKYYIVFAVILVFITINAYFFYPETGGHSLEEIALIFDGPSSSAPRREFVETLHHKGDLEDYSHVEKA
ncbi:hypothetical protein BP5796_09377 [Coleophoma crateriformis]|uniref:Major facilitator superfamily (MFS) profile domain-containing protein n=1 Tax=Coleophoma crateriformis TaxID=565419 RepID=A0A3D8QY72_9HELO|nr:hypothetical protein BP5796_09377 [Coleophoma crateriformis]